jgi:hypothetical protein
MRRRELISLFAGAVAWPIATIKTPKPLGIALPQLILGRADEVIE